MSGTEVAEGVRGHGGAIGAADGAYSGSRYPCPHGCTTHTVPSLYPTACGHYHSPSEWGHREQIHNSEYWAAIGKERP